LIFSQTLTYPLRPNNILSKNKLNKLNLNLPQLFWVHL
jgi:hypothetical protein